MKPARFVGAAHQVFRFIPETFCYYVGNGKKARKKNLFIFF